MICENCGTSIPSGTDTCAFCGQSVQQQPAAPAQVSITPQKSENMITGIVGALIGAAIGGGAIILISQIGYVAAVPAFITVGAIEASTYFTNLLMIYGFAALGAFSTLRDLFRK